MESSLAQTFFALAGTGNAKQMQKLWTEIQTLHSEPHLHYHTLAHIAQIAAALDPVWDKLQNADAVLFALFYHDSIYELKSNQNEAQSAMLAYRRMQELGVAAETIQKCSAIILATKAHEKTGDSDTDLFTDADLSILGAPWEIYEQYAQNVRAEYAVYEDAAYHAGRAKVLKHFLQMERIFKTDYFFETLELAARANLRREIQLYICMYS